MLHPYESMTTYSDPSWRINATFPAPTFRPPTFYQANQVPYSPSSLPCESTAVRPLFFSKNMTYEGVCDLYSRIASRKQIPA